MVAADLPAPAQGADRPGSAASLDPRAGKKKKRSLVSRVLPMARKIIAVALLVGGMVYGAVAPVRGFVNDRVVSVKARALSVIHPQYTPVHPFQVTGATATKDHPASALSDGFTNTFWAAPSTGDPTFILKFDHSVHVDQALLLIGVSGNFQGANRPSELRLVFSNGHTQNIQLDDKPDEQKVAIKTGGKITSIEVHVIGFYRAGSSDAVAITEIELFAKK